MNARFLYIIAIPLLWIAFPKEATRTAPPEAPLAASAWIASGPEAEDFDTTYAAPFFRKEFSVREGLTKATAFVTSGGYFNFFMNGERVSDRYLDPAVTRYDKTVSYVSFEVTQRLKTGKNAVGVVLANGFYNVDTESAWQFDEAPWRNRPALRFDLELMYEDGTRERVRSDRSWHCATGPITFDQLRNGEYYDNRLDLGNWSSAGYAAASWSPATVVAGPAGKLVEQSMPAIKKSRTLSPVSITEPVEGRYVVDFGQNLSGWASITVNEAAGTEIKMTYGERIHADGTLDVEELSRFIKSGETQTTRYTAAGVGEEYYEPSSTYFGFQYVEIEGLSKAPRPESIRAFVVHTAFDTLGTFVTSDPLINQLHENIQWSYLSNYHSFPEDCPHREKMGWTGDAQLVVQTGLYNFDVRSAFRKWLGDFRDEQPASGALPGIIPTSGWGYEITHMQQPYYGPHWEGAAVAVPWQVYRWTGDTAILRDNFQLMISYLDFLQRQTEGDLLLGGIDDHKSLNTYTGGDYLSSAYYHYFLGIVANIGDILGKGSVADRLRQRSQRVRRAFITKYYDSEKGIYGNGGQTQLAVALGCGLVPADQYGDILNKLITLIKENDYHFDSGVIGVKQIIAVLLASDRPDILHRLATQTSFPSFGYWVQRGANTMWQNWDGSQSRNHIMFGSIGDYFYQGLAGINPVTAAPGFQEILLKPYFASGMSRLHAEHRTPQGWLRTDWQREDGHIDYSVEVPGGSTAILRLRDVELINSGYQIGENKREITLPAGRHRLRLREI